MPNIGIAAGIAGMPNIGIPEKTCNTYQYAGRHSGEGGAAADVLHSIYTHTVCVCKLRERGREGEREREVRAV